MKDYEQLTQKTNEFLQSKWKDYEAIYEEGADNIVVRRREAYDNATCCGDGISCVMPLVDFARDNNCAVIVSSRPRKGTFILEDHCYPCILLF